MTSGHDDDETPAPHTPDTPEERRLKYIGVGISLGVSFGAGFGLLLGQLFFENFVLGMPIGIGLGVAVGVGVGLLLAAAPSRPSENEGDPGDGAP